MKALLELLDQLLYVLEEHGEPGELEGASSAEARRVLEGLAREALAMAQALKGGADATDLSASARREELLQRALEAISQARWQDAEGVLNAALGEFPEHDEYYNHLGLVAWERGDMARAEVHYARAAELAFGGARDGDVSFSSAAGRNYLRALEGRALCLYQLGRFEEAIEHFETLAYTNVPEYQGCHYLAGEVHHLCARPTEAAARYQLAPIEPSVLYNLALAKFQLDDHEEAAAVFIRAFASNRAIARMLLGEPLTSDGFDGYLSSPMYAEDFVSACQPLWHGAQDALEFMRRCVDHPLVRQSLDASMSTEPIVPGWGDQRPGTEELARVRDLALRVLERCTH